MPPAHSTLRSPHTATNALCSGCLTKQGKRLVVAAYVALQQNVKQQHTGP